MRKMVTILGIDNFSRKNISELRCLEESGCQLDVFTANSLGDSIENFNSAKFGQLYVMKKKFFSRVFQLVAYLIKNKKRIACLEIYPGGRFALIYILLAKCFFLPIIVVERGDLLIIKDKPMIARFFYYCIYRMARLVIYKEPYMRRMLKNLGVKNLFFLQNSVLYIPSSNDGEEFSKKTIDFLWVNRLVKERKIAWLLDLLELPDFVDKQATIAGVLNKKADLAVDANQRILKTRCLENVNTLEYCKPDSLYRQAKFFVLPSDIVFANNALLEAMSFGVVPLVSRVEGADIIVQDGKDGFLFEHTKEGLKEAMLRAINLSESDYLKFSQAAREKIQKQFSYAGWSKKLLEAHSLVEPSFVD